MPVKVKYLILGGGPSGLILAANLLKSGEKSFLILEKENEPGGLCRSREIDHSMLDIGGGHFLDVRNRKVLDFVFGFLPENEWERFDRISKIRTPKFEIDYPYEANIWQLPVDEQIEHLKSISNAGSNIGRRQPEKFSEWITWKLGSVIAHNYMLPYNSKIFSDVRLDKLGTYWLYKLPNVSFEDTLRSCLLNKPCGTLPAHSQFYYPRKYGYGEVFSRIADFIGKDKILLNYSVKTIEVDHLGVNNEIFAEKIITTIPWPELLTSRSIPVEIRRIIRQLRYSSIDITYRSSNQSTNAHWTYFPDENLPYHRLLFRHNFIAGAKGYWEETNSRRVVDGQPCTHHNEYAYPINTRHKPEVILKIMDWAKSFSIFSLGRWGEWEHMNSDVAMNRAINLADHLVSA
ncbi:protoporphyrinogen oxidase [Longilinea arvoryzae]|uniref:Protoporphyrinogen oxidase n=1 Tax=Longilinea arvoryzae TaxID=360412 RepID=A0A0S7BJK7_9CHLR|nr:NAD(P)-binding protein [Longilinea arvoryzae]GAP15833.1 protoporphyrinogen oxidase [Longilinea arvoryzae]